MLSLPIYSYATGTFSSRKIEQATYDSLSFRSIACNEHPDHDTLSTFRHRFGAEFANAFAQVLQVARENRMTRLGTVSLDGTKIHANASRQSARSYGHAEKIEAQLRGLAAIAEAKAKIAAVAQERFAREQTTYEAKRAAPRPRKRPPGRSPVAGSPPRQRQVRAPMTGST